VLNVVINIYKYFKLSSECYFSKSGLLSSYLFIKHIASKDYKITPAYMIKFYIHRLWRITPPLMLIIMFTTALTPFIGSGPIYPYSYGLEWLCRDNWWANLLYINNLRDITKMCFGVTWYLGNDMQFHWLSPILLIPLALG
jgi:peptidoglycan/LPS O-acetylase OafA/YrhL